MTAPSSVFQAKTERLKLAAIPVLVAGLYWAVTSSGDSPPAQKDVGRKPSVTPSHTGHSAENAEPTKPLRTRSLASLPLAHILEHDPFQMPTPLLPRSLKSLATEPAVSAELGATPPETVESPPAAPHRDADEKTSREQQWAAVRQRKVNVVLQDARGPVAMIGKKLVRVGDTLEDNVRVVAIDQQGIVLELISPQ